MHLFFSRPLRADVFFLLLSLRPREELSSPWRVYKEDIKSVNSDGTAEMKNKEEKWFVRERIHDKEREDTESKACCYFLLVKMIAPKKPIQHFLYLFSFKIYMKKNLSVNHSKLWRIKLKLGEQSYTIAYDDLSLYTQFLGFYGDIW